MIAMYALYGDSLYKICDQELAPNGISVNRDNNVEHAYDARKGISQVNMTLANSITTVTNGGYYKYAVNRIETEKLTEVEKLASIYRIFLGFRLLDANDILVDEGYIVKDIKPSLKFTPCHLDDKNEFLNAFSLEFNSRFTRHYSTPVATGWRQATKAPAYRLYITSVSVYQMKMSALTLQPSDKRTLVPITDAPMGVTPDQYGSAKDTPFRNWNAMVAQSRANMLDQSSFTDDGRLAYTMDPNFVKDSVCIFSTAESGVKFTSIDLAFAPRCIEVNLKLRLDGVFVVNSDEDITKYLEANKETPSITPDPGTEKPDESVVNPSNPDDGKVIPNPENPNAGTEEGKGPTEDTSTDGGSESDPSTGTGEEAKDPKPTSPEEGTSSDPVEDPEETETV